MVNRVLGSRISRKPLKCTSLDRTEMDRTVILQIRSVLKVLVLENYGPTVRTDRYASLRTRFRTDEIETKHKLEHFMINYSYVQLLECHDGDDIGLDQIVTSKPRQKTEQDACKLIKIVQFFILTQEYLGINYTIQCNFIFVNVLFGF